MTYLTDAPASEVRDITLAEAVAEFRSAQAHFTETGLAYISAPAESLFYSVQPLEQAHSLALTRLGLARRAVVEAALREFPAPEKGE